MLGIVGENRTQDGKISIGARLKMTLCYRNYSNNPMPYLNKKEADASFDEAWRSSKLQSFEKYQKEEILKERNKLRTADLDALIEHCKGMENPYDIDSTSTFYEGFEKFRADQKYYLTSLKETNK